MRNFASTLQQSSEFPKRTISQTNAVQGTSIKPHDKSIDFDKHQQQSGQHQDQFEKSNQYKKQEILQDQQIPNPPLISKVNTSNISRNEPEQSSIREGFEKRNGRVNLPPTTAEMNIQNDDSNNPGIQANLPPLPPKKKEVSETTNDGLNVNDTGPTSFDKDTPVPLKQPTVSIEYLPITFPENPIVSVLLFLPRLLIFLFKVFLINAFYIVMILSIWLYLMDDVRFLGVHVPSGVVGANNFVLFASSTLDLLPDSVLARCEEIVRFIVHTLNLQS